MKKALSSVLCLVVLCAFSVVTSAAAKDNRLDKTLSIIKKADLTFGSEWLAVALARAGAAVPESYLETAESELKARGGRLEKISDHSRLTIALSALGENAADFRGYDVTAPLSEYSAIESEGISSAIYALIAKSTLNPPQEDSTLVDQILAASLPYGGWSWGFGDDLDIDITAMALTALAPFVSQNSVKTAVGTALDLLSASQDSSGAWLSWGSASAETNAQVVVALTALGIDPSADPRFVKAGGSAYSAIFDFYLEGGGFFSSWDEDKSQPNQFSTEQAAHAMVAYERFASGKPALFDMSDVWAAPIVELPAAPEAENPKTSETDTLVVSLSLLALAVAALVVKKHEKA